MRLEHFGVKIDIRNAHIISNCLLRNDTLQAILKNTYTQRIVNRIYNLYMYSRSKGLLFIDTITAAKNWINLAH